MYFKGFLLYFLQTLLVLGSVRVTKFISLVVSQPREILPPTGHLAMSAEIFGCLNKEVLLASSLQRSELLLNILQ